MDWFFLILMIIIGAETTFMFILRIRDINRLTSRMNRRKLFVDTSALIDGRILAVAKAGFLGDEVLIPRSVIRELQLLADGSDSEKRTRARFGLDVANELERVELATVEIYHDEPGRVQVDERLIELAKQHHGIILTNDYNLIKVAATEKIDAININDLAQGLRSEFLPGETLKVKIVTTGSNPHQGIAYLPDGTMVVVDGADRYVGKDEIDVEFVRFLQTAAGKMMFAKLRVTHSETVSRASRTRSAVRKAKPAGRKAQSATAPSSSNKRSPRSRA
ncbi:hypothetical protein IKF15_03615 [Candidatus Saccharibacteria bacterium]|nr:hypothetical protein [Candidatus Saccharibacteria bacterium]